VLWIVAVLRSGILTKLDAIAYFSSIYSS